MPSQMELRLQLWQRIIPRIIASSHNLPKRILFSMYITEDFDAAAELQRLNEIRRARRKQSVTRRSRLDKHGFELIRLYQEGATYSALAIYLRERRIVVHETTISRWIKKRIA